MGADRDLLPVPEIPGVFDSFGIGIAQQAGIFSVIG
jgi:hypothetical protein